MSIFFWWLIAIIVFLLIYWFAVRGRTINWYGLFLALPGIIWDLLCQAWLDITDRLPWRRKKEVELDEYERRLS